MKKPRQHTIGIIRNHCKIPLFYGNVPWLYKNIKPIPKKEQKEYNINTLTSQGIYVTILIQIEYPNKTSGFG